MPMSELQAKKLVAAMIAAYPTTKITDDSAAVYVRMLFDLDFDAVNAAIAKLIATCKFPPSVAEIREATLAVSKGDRRAGGDAWGDVLHAIRRFGYARTPGRDFELEDPIVLECIKAFGWQELCSSENQVADRARFIELYDKLAAEDRRRDLSENLPAVQRFRALQEARQGSLAGRSAMQLISPGVDEERSFDARPGDGEKMLADLAVMTAQSMTDATEPRGRDGKR